MFRLLPLCFLLMTGCAGMGRSWSNFSAETVGADWVVVKTNIIGSPFRCWTLRDAAVTNETQSDGIYWVDRETGNLVHVSGFYDRVQVVGGNWERAYKELGLTEETCHAVHGMQFSPQAGTYELQ